MSAGLSPTNRASAKAIGRDVPIEPVFPDSLEHLDPRIKVVARDVVNDQNPLRHDPDKLAAVLLELAQGNWRDDDQEDEPEAQTRTANRRDFAGASTGD